MNDIVEQKQTYKLPEIRILQLIYISYNLFNQTMCFWIPLLKLMRLILENLMPDYICVKMAM